MLGDLKSQMPDVMLNRFREETEPQGPARRHIPVPGFGAFTERG